MFALNLMCLREVLSTGQIHVLHMEVRLCLRDVHLLSLIAIQVIEILTDSVGPF
jgi:hypothetical protein